MKVDVSLGDVVDRITICALKVQRIADPRKVAHAANELQALRQAWQSADQPTLESLPQYHPLLEVNARLWEVEDALRDHEHRADFGESFITLARSVYRLNDQRAALKLAINTALGSTLVEVKGYGGQEGRIPTTSTID